MSKIGGHAVIVGAGQAGFSVASSLRAQGFAGRVTLLGNEALPPYQRPPLSKSFLLQETTEEQLLLRPRSFYADQRIDLQLGTRVDAIDAQSARLRLGDGSTLPYDMLCLATGATPRVWPRDAGGALENVVTLRAVADVRNLSQRLDTARTVVIIGGGYLGLELAASFSQRGLRVTVIEVGERILQRVAAADTAAWIRSLHEVNGVTIRENTAVRELVGARRVEAVLLSDGTTLPADLVVVAIGVEPNISLAQDAGLTLEGGICVDDTMRTSVSTIWAAGDCAAFVYRGRRRRIESVGNAIDTGEAVARSMLGDGTVMRTVPWFWSDQYDLRLQIAGHCDGYDTVHIRHSQNGVSHWYYRRDELLAVDAINDSRAYMVARRLLEMGRNPPLAAVLDTSVDLKQLLK